LEAGADVSYGSYNAVDAGGFVSGPITDTLGARFSIDHTQMDGWQRATPAACTMARATSPLAG